MRMVPDRALISPLPRAIHVRTASRDDLGLGRATEVHYFLPTGDSSCRHAWEKSNAVHPRVLRVSALARSPQAAWRGRLLFRGLLGLL